MLALCSVTTPHARPHGTDAWPTFLEVTAMKAGDTNGLTQTSTMKTGDTSGAIREKHTAHQYILGADDSEHARLLAVCEMRRPQAELLFQRLGIGCGQRVIDIGCGPLGVLDLLSARVDPPAKSWGWTTNLA